MPGPARGPGMNAMFADGSRPGNRCSLCALRARQRPCRMQKWQDPAGRGLVMVRV